MVVIRRLRNPFTQAAKSALVRVLHRRGLELIADPYADRLERMLAHRGIDTILDGGANVGQYAAGLRAAGFTGRLVSIEPLASAYSLLERASASDPLWTVHQAALSDVPGTIRMNVAANLESSSALKMLPAHAEAAPHARYVGTEEVPAITIDSLVSELGLDPATTLVKLDIQGFENVALRGAAHTLKSCAALQLELSFVPLYEGSWLADEVIAFATKHGFELWMWDPSGFNDPETGRLLQCDAVFVR